jgi:hypothetical protein
MLKLFSRKAPATSQVVYSIRMRVSVHGTEIPQTQVVTENYVFTTVGPTSLLFRPQTGGRYLVDHEKRTLKPLDLTAQLAQMEQLRDAIGEVSITSQPAAEPVDGYTCTHHVIRTEHSRIMVEGEMFSTRIPGLERTALGAERRFDKTYQPFGVSLEDDELVVHSRTSLVSAGFEQSQETRLESVAEGAPDLALLDAAQGYKVVS